MRPIEVVMFTSPQERGATNGTFYLAGAVVAAMALVDPAAQRVPIVVIVVAAVLVGVASIVGRDRFTPAVTHSVVALASALIGITAVLAGGGIGSVLLMTDYLLVAVFVALLGSTRAIMAHTAWATATLVTAALVLWPVGTALAVTAAFMAVAGAITVVSALLASRLRRSATTDPLTGVANRGGFNQALAAAVATVERTAEPLTVLLLDLDGFKQVNDERGHAAGDDLLRTATANWSRHIRARDTLARLGGDEFAVVMPGASRLAATHVATRLAAATPQVGCSVGIASWSPGTSVDRLLADADEDLYAVKRRSRGQAPVTP